MKKDIFENKAHPFTVPDGYFDTLNERIMNRIQAEENHQEVKGRIIRMPLYRKLIAAAACILFIFAGATLYFTNHEKQLVLAEFAIDDDFYQWLFASENATLMAETLDIRIDENIVANHNALSEEDRAIIQFLERDNINVAAILYAMY